MHFRQGIANAQSNLMLDKLHELQLMQMSIASNGSDGHTHAVGHGMRLAEVQAVKQLEQAEAPRELALTDVDASTTKAAAALEEAATGSQRRLASDHTVAQLRGLSGAGERKASRKIGLGHHGEEET